MKKIAVVRLKNHKSPSGSFKFIDIPKVIEVICEKHKCDLNLNPSLTEILEIDSWARKEVLDYSVKNITKISVQD